MLTTHHALFTTKHTKHANFPGVYSIWRLASEAAFQCRPEAEDLIKIKHYSAPPGEKREEHTHSSLILKLAVFPSRCLRSWSGQSLQVPGLRWVFSLHGEQLDEGGSVFVWTGLPVGGWPAMSEHVCCPTWLLPRRGVSHSSWTRGCVQVNGYILRLLGC